MFKILKYSFFDLVRSRWSVVYLAFYLLLGFVLLFLNNDLSADRASIFTWFDNISMLIAYLGRFNNVLPWFRQEGETSLVVR